MAMSFLLLSGIVLPLLVLLLTSLSKNHCNGNSLPPAPWPRLPLIGSLFFHPPTMASLAKILGRLHAAHGPVVSPWVGSTPAIFISCHDIAHRTLVHMGSTFAHRPATAFSGLSSHGVSCATYGSRWALLRRNLSSHLVARPHVVTGVLRSSGDRLVRILESAAEEDGGGAGGGVAPRETFRHAVFGFFAALCFGDGVEEDMLGRLRALDAEILSLVVELDAFHLLPAFLKVVYYFTRWRKLYNALKRHHILVATIISARRTRREESAGLNVAESRCYLDTLLGFQLGEDEMVSLCWEYMNASVKATATALGWIMARLVLHQDIQQKLQNDIMARRASGSHTTFGEKQRPFVEALRLHPPAHYLLAHTTDKDVSLGKFLIPKGSVVNFGVASIGRDATLWADPNIFRPERFMEGGEGSGVHCTSSGGSSCKPETTKMIPFGAGRRACPGAPVAMALLQLFVEDLVMRFEWKQATASAVVASIDMTEKPGIIIGDSLTS